jgi:hypothetical protein
LRLGIRKIRLAASIAFVAVLVALVALPSVASGVGGETQVIGKVTGSGGVALQKIKVCLDPTDPEGIGFCTDTDAGGEWESTFLAPGTYTVEFSDDGSGHNVAPRFYANAKRRADATLVELKTGQITTVNQTLTEAGGAITGTVRSAENGKPLADVTVCADAEFFTCERTNASGEYLLFGLAAEAQTIVFLGDNSSLEVQYYDHRLFESQATPLAIHSGQVLDGIDADMRVGARISGHVYSPDELPLPNIEVCAVAVDAPEAYALCESSQAGGAYTIRGLPPATYKVAFSPSPADAVPGLDSVRFEDDSWPSQFWNLRRTFALGETLTLAVNQQVSGIDAHLGHYIDPPLASVVAPNLGGATATPAPAPPKPQPLKCKKNQRKVTVKKKGKSPVQRCVTKKPKKHHHRHAKKHRAGH